MFDFWQRIDTSVASSCFLSKSLILLFVRPRISVHQSVVCGTPGTGCYQKLFSSHDSSCRGVVIEVFSSGNQFLILLMREIIRTGERPSVAWCTPVRGSFRYSKVRYRGGAWQPVLVCVSHYIWLYYYFKILFKIKNLNFRMELSRV